MFDSCLRLNNVIFNNNEDSTLIKNCYIEKQRTISILDFLPSQLFFINPSIFPTQNIIAPSVPALNVPNAFQPINFPLPVSSIVKPPMIVPNQALYAQPPIANIPKMPKNTTNFGINYFGNNIPGENIPIPKTVPYGNNFAPISSITLDTIPVRTNQYTNNVKLPNVKTYPIY